MRPERLGVLLGLAAIGLWSSTTSLIHLGGLELPAWTFAGLTAAIASAAQFGLHFLRGGTVRAAVSLPARAWPGLVLPFAAYGVVYPLAIMLSGERAVASVNLLNYFWPVLTVVFAVAMARGEGFSPALAASVLLATAGLVLANFPAAARLAGSGGTQSLLPLLLGLAAAVTWGFYSALMGRWAGRMRQFVTPPMGFACVAAVALSVAAARGELAWPASGQWLPSLACGLGPFAMGYLLWEKALHKAPAQVLGVLASMIPVLSTIILCTVQLRWPGAHVAVAAVLVGSAVLLATRSRRGGGRTATAAAASLETPADSG
jgi:drug/metabolite transporter (DMT)-like permease